MQNRNRNRTYGALGKTLGLDLGGVVFFAPQPCRFDFDFDFATLGFSPWPSLLFSQKVTTIGGRMFARPAADPTGPGTDWSRLHSKHHSGEGAIPGWTRSILAVVPRSLLSGGTVQHLLALCAFRNCCIWCLVWGSVTHTEQFPFGICCCTSVSTAASTFENRCLPG